MSNRVKHVRIKHLIMYLMIYVFIHSSGCTTVSKSPHDTIMVKAKILTLIECYIDDGEDDAGNPTFIGENSAGIMIVAPNDFSGMEKRIVFNFGLLREGSGWIFEPVEWYPIDSYIRFRVSRKDLKKYYRLDISSIKDIDTVLSN